MNDPKWIQEGIEPTPEEWTHWYLTLEKDIQVEVAAQILESRAIVHACFVADHEGRLGEYRHQVAQLQSQLAERLSTKDVMPAEPENIPSGVDDLTIAMLSVKPIKSMSTEELTEEAVTDFRAHLAGHDKMALKQHVVNSRLRKIRDMVIKDAGIVESPGFLGFPTYNEENPDD